MNAMSRAAQRLFAICTHMNARASLHVIRALFILLLFLILTPLPTLAASPPERVLINIHVNKDALAFALKNARDYTPVKNITAGVMPHHLTAAPLIGGFFTAVKDENTYDTVIITGPNHYPSPSPNGEEIAVSLKDWASPTCAECDTDIASQILKIELKDGRVIEDDDSLQKDHAVSTLIPFVNHCWPEARVAPLLISRSITYEDTLILADALTEIINASGKRVLLLCSIDFSHYLTPRESKIRDAETRAAIEQADLRTIHSFTDANVDSPASLIIFLRHLNNTGAAAHITDNADASEFTVIGPDGTTSYFLIIGSV